MKTAISMPDFVYHQVTSRAVLLGISRSEFFVHAAQHYLAELDSGELTAQINAALDPVDDSNTVAASAGRRMLAGVDDEW